MLVMDALGWFCYIFQWFGFFPAVEVYHELTVFQIAVAEQTCGARMKKKSSLKYSSAGLLVLIR